MPRRSALILSPMSVHLLKPALGIQDLYEFAVRQKARWMDHDGRLVYPVWTSRKPQRAEELLDGGSLYWIVKKQILCRQAVLDIIPYQQEGDEKPSYLILCSPDLVRTQSVKKKPFQGWRYLEAENAPADQGVLRVDDQPPPPALEKILREAGLI